MGIYIKDMDMPSYCEVCPLRYENGYSYHEYCSVNGQRIWEDKPDWCPLIFIEDKDNNDIVPVHYGCWIADKEDVEWGNYLIRYRCSECKERPHFDKDKYKYILSSYCPNCGARMVKEITCG